jgi:hypothetical protein
VAKPQQVEIYSRPCEEPSHWYRVVLVVPLSVTAWFWWRSRTRLRSVPGPEPSIALLPITNETRDPQADSIADGVTESVIRQLSGVPGLRVIGAASVFRYKDDQQDPRSLGRARLL